jgi:hypothetical protein
MNSMMVDHRGRTFQERSELRAKIDKLNAEAKANWDNPAWRRLMAQETTQTILEGFQHENLLQLLTNVENAPFDGRVFVKEIRGMRAFWVARGGYIEASTIRADVMELPRDTVGFHVYEFTDKLMTNFAETQSDLINLGIERMDAEVNHRVLRLFQAAIPPGHPSYLSGAGYTLATLNTAIREVQEETKEGEITIVGRRTMVDQIYEQLTADNNAGFLPETNEQVLRMGVLGQYRGARIVSLRNFKDDEDIPFWPANEMFVLGRDASRFAFWGGLMAKEWEEGDNWYWHYLARRDFGGVVYRPERARRIVDTSITP